MTTEQTVIALNVDGTEYRLTFEECTALDAKECRKQTGLSLRDIFGAASGGSPDLDSIAALVWLARVKGGESDLAFDDVAATIDYRTKIEGAGARQEDSSDPE